MLCTYLYEYKYLYEMKARGTTHILYFPNTKIIIKLLKFDKLLLIPPLIIIRAGFSIAK